MEKVGKGHASLSGCWNNDSAHRKNEAAFNLQYRPQTITFHEVKIERNQKMCGFSAYEILIHVLPFSQIHDKCVD